MPDPTDAATDFHVPAPVRTTALGRGRSRFSDIASLARWRRRGLIERIERETGRILLCYVSDDPPIDRDDVLSLQALLDPVPLGSGIDLLLHSPGGYVDVAEKLVYMLRKRVEGHAPSGGDHGLTVIVPERAKSAATLMTFGADRIVMSSTSELGPIDPQFEVLRGNRVEMHGVRAYLEAFQEAEELCRRHPENAVFRAAYERFDPLMAHRMRQEINRVGHAVEDLLQGSGSNYTLASRKFVAERWMDPQVLPTHEQTISYGKAQEFGLTHVEYVEPTTLLWRMYWTLYQALRKVCGDDRKVFESSALSRIVE